MHSPVGSRRGCHVPCHFFILPFIFIRSHSFPLFISIFRYSFPFSVHSPVSDSSAHVSGLLSVLRVPYISRVLVLDRSRLITCVVSLFRRFTLATISYGAPFVITCSLLPCSGLVRPSPFTCICFHLLPVVISPLLFRQPCLLSSSPVLGSTSRCPLLNFLVPPFPSPPESAPSARLLLSEILSPSSTVVVRLPSRSTSSSRAPASGPRSSRPGLPFARPGLSFLCPGLPSLSTWLST